MQNKEIYMSPNKIALRNYKRETNIYKFDVTTKQTNEFIIQKAVSNT